VPAANLALIGCSRLRPDPLRVFQSKSYHIGPD
jgi:hypothetical protein